MMCSNWVSFWYCSVAVFFFEGPLGAGSSIMLSFSISRNGFDVLPFFAGAFFCFFELGGVFESKDASLAESRLEGRSLSSSSLSGFGRFFETAFALRVVWTIFFGAVAFAAFGAKVFLGAPFALPFYGRAVSKVSLISSWHSDY